MALRDFWNGYGSLTIKSLPNPDEGRKKYRFIESFLVNIFSKIVDSDTLFNAFKDNNDMLIIRALREYGISEKEFIDFTHLIGEAIDSNTKEKESFAEAQYLLLSMYRRKIETLVSRGEVKKDSVRAAITTFGTSLIWGKEFLRTTFPFNDVGYLRLNIDDVGAAVRQTIRTAEEDCEKMEAIHSVRYFKDGTVFNGPRQAPLGGRSR
jgi:hypothetical protein